MPEDAHTATARIALRSLRTPHARLRHRVIVLAAAAVLGLAGGAWLTAVNSGETWFYVLGLMLTAITALRLIVPLAPREPVEPSRPAEAPAESAEARDVRTIRDPEGRERHVAEARPGRWGEAGSEGFDLAVKPRAVPDLMEALEASLAAAAGHQPEPPLSDHERELIALVAAGFSRAEIAERLMVSEAVVRQALARAMHHFRRLSDDWAQLQEKAERDRP